MKHQNGKFKQISGGFAAGFVNALLGAGGGMLAVPVLKKLGMSQKQAQSNSVAVIMPLSAISVAIYLYSESVSISAAFPDIHAGLLGSLLGTFLLTKLSNKWLKKLFALFMIWAGVRLLLK